MSGAIGTVKLGKVVALGIPANQIPSLEAMLQRLRFSEVFVAGPGTDPVERLGEHNPNVILTGYRTPGYDGPALVTTVRRSALPCRRALVIMVASLATRVILAEARNAGIDEVLLQPFDEPNLQRRLEHLILKPRSWIEAMGYVGPDRRRFNTGDYQGPRKRQSSQVPGHLAHIEQSVRILKSAVEHFDSDPNQALRSIETQLKELRPACAVLDEAKFSKAVAQLVAALDEAVPLRESFIHPVRALAKFVKIDDSKLPPRSHE